MRVLVENALRQAGARCEIPFAVQFVGGGEYCNRDAAPEFTFVFRHPRAYWRIAAFIWMIIVAIGLALVVARIWLGRSTAWLVGMNALSLAAVLYVSSFVNMPDVIASYNVAHSAGREMALDIDYLTSLGPQAIPALGNTSSCILSGRVAMRKATASSTPGRPSRKES